MNNGHEANRFDYLGNMSPDEVRETTFTVENLLSDGKKEEARDFLNEEIAKHQDPLVGPIAVHDAEAGESTKTKSKWQNNKVIGGLVLTAAVGSLIFELSPANESIRIPPAADIFRETGSKEAVFGLVGALTLAIEVPTIVAVSAGLHYKRESINKAINFIQKFRSDGKKKPEKPEVVQAVKPEKESKLKGVITDTGLAFGIGASVLVAKKYLQNPDRTFKDNLSTGLKASLAVAGISGSIGYVSAALITNAEKLGSLKKPAEYFVDYAADWKFWMGVIGTIQIATYLKNKLTNVRRNQSDQKQIQDNTRNT